VQVSNPIEIKSHKNLTSKKEEIRCLL